MILRPPVEAHLSLGVRLRRAAAPEQPHQQKRGQTDSAPPHRPAPGASPGRHDAVIPPKVEPPVDHVGVLLPGRHLARARAAGLGPEYWQRGTDLSKAVRPRYSGRGGPRARPRGTVGPRCHRPDPGLLRQVLARVRHLVGLRSSLARACQGTRSRSICPLVMAGNTRVRPGGGGTNGS